MSSRSSLIIDAPGIPIDDSADFASQIAETVCARLEARLPKLWQEAVQSLLEEKEKRPRAAPAEWLGSSTWIKRHRLPGLMAELPGARSGGWGSRKGATEPSYQKDVFAEKTGLHKTGNTVRESPDPLFVSAPWGSKPSSDEDTKEPKLTGRQARRASLQLKHATDASVVPFSDDDLPWDAMTGNDPQRGKLLLHVCFPFLMCITGVLPWRNSEERHFYHVVSYLYQYLALILAFGAFVLGVVHVIQDRSDFTCIDSVCFVYMHMGDTVLALASFFGLVAAWSYSRHNVLGCRSSMLARRALQLGILKPWSRTLETHDLVTGVCWVLMVAVRVQLELRTNSPLSLDQNVSISAFALCSGVILALVQSMLHVAAVLTQMVDMFTHEFKHRRLGPDSSTSDWMDFLEHWNMLQTVLRRASGSSECVFITSLSAVCLTLIIGAVDMLLSTDSTIDVPVHFWLLCAAALPGLLVMRLMMRMADITQKCAQVPALVNSLNVGRQFDPRRQFLVEHITFTGAGYHIKGVRFTGDVFMKFFSAVFISIFGLLTRILSL